MNCHEQPQQQQQMHLFPEDEEDLDEIYYSNNNKQIRDTSSPHAVFELYPSQCCNSKNGSVFLPPRERVLKRLSESLLQRSLTKIDLSQRGLLPTDARLVKMALLKNTQLTVLKLGYNNLGDQGAAILAPAISSSLESLDLGFNNIGDQGCIAVCRHIQNIKTLYFSGNRIRSEGVQAIADVRGLSLRKLYLSGNPIGPEGVDAIAKRSVEEDSKLEELYLGATQMGDCQAVGSLLRATSRVKVLELSNCNIDDDAVTMLAHSIRANPNLPIELLQLSFNHITCVGAVHLVDALLGCFTIQELLLDNNEISDLGAQSLFRLAPKLQTLDVGFNKLKAVGIGLLMKASGSLSNLSLSGHNIDSTTARSICHSLAFGPSSLRSLSLIRCGADYQAKRHIAAGIVSNPLTELKQFEGFPLGPIIVTLGFPSALEKWNNAQILNFILIMWKNDHSINVEEEEKTPDPLQCLDDDNSSSSPCHMDPNTVIEVANRTFATLAVNGLDAFARSFCTDTNQDDCPIVSDHMMLVSGKHADTDNTFATSETSSAIHSSKSFVVKPELSAPAPPDHNRRKQLEEWVKIYGKDIHKVKERPFDAGELWRLHQHYFSPIINDGGVGAQSSGVASVPDVSRANRAKVTTPSTSQPNQLLKRKVSYRCLNDVCETKRTRRNRTRISFLPKVQSKLDSYLQESHEKALSLMRSLFFVERSLGKNQTHLSGSIALDAEMILMELL